MPLSIQRDTLSRVLLINASKCHPRYTKNSFIYLFYSVGADVDFLFEMPLFASL